MTRLERIVRRKAGDGREAYTVILHPETGSSRASVEVREGRRRVGYRIELGVLHTLLAMRAAGVHARRVPVRSRRLS